MQSIIDGGEHTADNPLWQARVYNNNALTVSQRALDWIFGSAAVGDGASLDLNFDNRDEYPVVLAANEGIVLENNITMGAAGKIRLGVDIAWSEIDPLVIL